MIFNLQNETEVLKFDDKCNYLKSKGYTVDLIQKKNTRTTKQNSALHVFFTIISSQLNELGIEYRYFGLKGKEVGVMHTPHLVKEFVWKPIQRILFDIESTTKINTEQINKITDVLIKYFGEMGVLIQFPSIEHLMIE